DLHWPPQHRLQFLLRQGLLAPEVDPVHVATRGFRPDVHHLETALLLLTLLGRDRLRTARQGLSLHLHRSFAPLHFYHVRPHPITSTHGPTSLPSTPGHPTVVLQALLQVADRQRQHPQIAGDRIVSGGVLPLTLAVGQ